jgi:hypothetical protein
MLTLFVTRWCISTTMTMDSGCFQPYIRTVTLVLELDDDDSTDGETLKVSPPSSGW